MPQANSGCLLVMQFTNEARSEDGPKPPLIPRGACDEVKHKQGQHNPNNTRLLDAISQPCLAAGTQ